MGKHLVDPILLDCVWLIAFERQYKVTAEKIIYYGGYGETRMPDSRL